jgi:Bacterial SH3 domain
MPRRDTPLSIEIPAPDKDRPQWTHVGVVAAVGFVLGILWPRYTGTRVAPNPPSEATAASAEEKSVPAAPGPPAATAAPATASAAAPALGIHVGQGIVLRCRDTGNEDFDGDCGAILLDPIAVPRLKGLVECPAAKGASGKLSIALDVDFHKRKVRVVRGKRTTLPDDTTRGLLRCAESAFASVPLDEVTHQHRRYMMIYSATFGAEAKPVAPVPEPTERAPAEGTAGAKPAGEALLGNATVLWDVAILREAPKSGAVVGRAVHGAKVKVLAQQGEWFRVRYGAIEGWAYRGAIGL